MSAQALSSRAVIGMYYEALAIDPGLTWMDAVSNYFTSDQDSETYKWLGMPPALREWIGGRQSKGFTTEGIEIRNKHYEATLAILLKDLRRDKTSQLQARIGEFAQRGTSHFASLLSTLIINGPSTVCYDGQFFFDTDHSEGDSGTLDNDITTDISAVPQKCTVLLPRRAKKKCCRRLLIPSVSFLLLKMTKANRSMKTRVRFT